MDKVYSLATWTICAAAGPDAEVGLPGVHTRQREFYIDTRRQTIARTAQPTRDDSFIDGSYWNSRGWNFQERELSRRCLFFCDRRIYWNCATVRIEEEADQFCEKTWDTSKKSLINRGDIPPRKTSRKTRSYYFWPNVFDEGEADEFDGGYRWLVQEYTGRDLRDESDILAAFAGVGSYWSESYNTRLLFEIPERFFEVGLSWECWSRTSLRSCLDLPSWSWASQVGPIRYNFRIESRLVQFFFFSEDSKLLRIDSGIPHTNDDGWNVGRSDWRSGSTSWIPESMELSPPSIPPQLSAILKPGTMIFQTQVVKLEIGVEQGVFPGDGYLRGPYLGLYTLEPNRYFAGLIEGTARNEDFLASLMDFLSDQTFSFVGFAASYIDPGLNRFLLNKKGSKGDHLVVAWLVRFDDDGVAHRIAIARIFLWLWEAGGRKFPPYF